MFLDTGEIKTVHANKDNMEYYNNIYEEMKSAEEKQRTKKLRELNESVKNKPAFLLKKFFCCGDKFTPTNKKQKIEDIVIEELVYSSGE